MYERIFFFSFNKIRNLFWYKEWGRDLFFSSVIIQNRVFYTLFCWVIILELILYLYIEICIFNFFLRFYLFLGRGREGEREGEKCQCVVASHTPPTGDLAHNPGMCPDWESNQGHFGLQAGTQSTEPHQPGHVVVHFVPHIASYWAFELAALSLSCGP